MTRERDRILLNANNYIVKNCPAFTQAYEHCCNLDGNYKCEYCTDCVIKQIITICKSYEMSKKDMKRSKEFADIIRGSKYGSDALAIQILQLFDIEEINK